MLLRSTHVALFLFHAPLPGKPFPPPQSFLSGSSKNPTHFPRRQPCFLQEASPDLTVLTPMAVFGATLCVIKKTLSLYPVLALSFSLNSAYSIINIYVLVSPTKLWASWRYILGPSHQLPAHNSCSINVCWMNEWKTMSLMQTNEMNEWGGSEHSLFIGFFSHLLKLCLLASKQHKDVFKEKLTVSSPHLCLCGNLSMYCSVIFSMSLVHINMYT